MNTAELLPALEDVLGRHFGARRVVVRLEHRPSAYRSSFAIEELDAWLEDGTALCLLVKDVSRDALLAAARRVKPAFLHDPRREIETYRDVLAPARLGTAVCYGAVLGPPEGRAWLFLERVSGRELYQVGEFAAWQQAARWLAGLHARFAGATRGLPPTVPLLRYDGDFYRLWLRRAREFAPAPAARRGLDRLAGRYDEVVERLLGLPLTFLHGEFYASNVLVEETADGVRVCPVDWEMAAIGPGLADLAALTAGDWTEEQRTALALAYHAALARAGDEPAPTAPFLAALDCCRLHLAVQWLGWAPGWSPPAGQRQDWLGEALRLADKLGL